MAQSSRSRTAPVRRVRASSVSPSSQGCARATRAAVGDASRSAPAAGVLARRDAAVHREEALQRAALARRFLVEELQAHALVAAARAVDPAERALSELPLGDEAADLRARPRQVAVDDAIAQAQDGRVDAFA